MRHDGKIYIAGHTGLVGSALLRRCEAAGYANVVTRSHAELDLCDNRATADFFDAERPDYVLLAAAKVGGILANRTYPADFIYTNLMIQTSVLEAARHGCVRRLIFFGSACAYPVGWDDPIPEEALLTAPIEESSQPYAVAKIAGMELCKAYRAQYGVDFISVIPCTLYGPNDNFDPRESHVMSALIRRFHEAAVRARPPVESIAAEPVAVWGSGRPRREFLYVDDLADACILLMGLDRDAVDSAVSPATNALNVGSGADVSIESLADRVRDVVGFSGDIVFDRSKPDGAPRKLLDSARIRRLGWTPKVSLDEGLKRTYEWYRARTTVA